MMLWRSKVSCTSEPEHNIYLYVFNTFTGVNLTGTIAIARYGGNFRGLKVSGSHWHSLEKTQ